MAHVESVEERLGYPHECKPECVQDKPTDRELIEEMHADMRAMRKLVDDFFGDLQSGKINPMQMMMGMFKK